MRMGIGLGVGINRSNYAQGIFGAYATRVVADGGVVEGGACVDAVSGLLLNASLLLIPSGYKGGKLYAEIPTNGNGDLTWTRASTAIRTNSSGLLESMATGVPRLSYMYGSCPAVLLEPQRTNSLRNSTMVGAVAGSPGTVPTNWQFFSNSNLTRTIVGTGTENGLTYLDIRYSGTATFSGTGEFFYCELQSQIAALINQNWTSSFYLKSISGTIPSTVITIRENNSSGIYVDASTTSVSMTSTLQRFNFTRTLTGATTAYVSAGILFTTVLGTSYDFTFRIAQPQMELGAYVTTPIPTTTASATRIADSFSRNNIYTNGLISASGGTWFVELRGNVSYVRDAGSTGLSLDVSALVDGLAIRNTASGRLAIQKFISSTSTLLYTTTTDTTKIAIKWNGTTADVFANGTKVVSATSFTLTALQNLGLSSGQVPYFIQQMALYPSPLSDTDCTTLTTL